MFCSLERPLGAFSLGPTLQRCYFGFYARLFLYFTLFKALWGLVLDPPGR
jgi:hypothetical protein